MILASHTYFMVYFHILGAFSIFKVARQLRSRGKKFNPKRFFVHNVNFTLDFFLILAKSCQKCYISCKNTRTRFWIVHFGMEIQNKWEIIMFLGSRRSFLPHWSNYRNITWWRIFLFLLYFFKNWVARISAYSFQVTNDKIR